MKKVLFLLLILIGSSWAQDFAVPESRYSIKPYKSFVGGMVSNKYPSQLSDDQWLLLENLVFTEEGRLKKRKGFGLWSENTGVNHGKAPTGLYRWFPNPDTSEVLYAVSDKLYRDTTVAGAIELFQIPGRTFTQPNEFYFEQFRNEAYFVNGQDSNGVYNFGAKAIQNWGLLDSLVGYSLKDTIIRVRNRVFSLNELVGYFLYMNYTTATKRWVRITYNNVDTIRFSVPTCSTAKAIAILGALPISGINEDSGQVDSVKRGAQACTGSPIYEHEFFVTNHPWTDGQLNGLPYIFQIRTGKMDGFSEFVYTVDQRADTADSYIIFLDTNVYKTADFDTSSKYIVYKRLPLSSKFIKQSKNRMWYGYNHNSGGASDKSPKLPNYIWYSNDFAASDIYSPDWVKSTQFLDLNTADGDVITGLANQYQTGYDQPFATLIAFKNRHIFDIYGTVPSDFRIFEVANDFGCIAPRSIANWGNLIFFLSHKGAYIKSPEGFDYVSKQIQDFLDKIDRRYVRRCSGAVIQNDYYLSTPDTAGAGLGKDTLNSVTWIYSLITKSWTKASFGAGIWAVTNTPFNKPRRQTERMTAQSATADTFQYLFTSTLRDSVYHFGVTTTDTGVSITASIESKWEDMGIPFVDKRYRECWLEFDKTAGNLIVQGYNDYSASASFTDTLTDTGKKVKRVDFGPVLVNNNFKLKLSTTSTIFDLASISLRWMPMKRRQQ